MICNEWRLEVTNVNQSSLWKKAVEDEWDDQAEVWDKRAMNMWENGSRKDIIPFIKKHVNKRSRILDVGCGSGYGTITLYDAGYKIDGVDISSKMISLANRRLHDRKITFFQYDVNDISLLDKKYGAVLAINVLEWTNTPSQALNELGEILEKNGLLCVGILGPTAGPRAHGFRHVYGENVIINRMMPWEFNQLAEESGFSLVDHFGVYKKEVNETVVNHLSLKLKQALSFMWVFMLRKS